MSYTIHPVRAFSSLALAWLLWVGCGGGARDDGDDAEPQTDAGMRDAQPDTADEVVACLNHGSQFDARFQAPEVCCEGLVPRDILSEESGILCYEGCCFEGTPNVRVCLDCGNGLCDFAENRCSCPEDCGPVISEDAGGSADATSGDAGASD